MWSIKYVDFVGELFVNSINSEFDEKMGKYKCNYTDIVGTFNTIRNVGSIDQINKSDLACAIHRLTWYSNRGGVHGQTACKLLTVRQMYIYLYALIEDLETETYVENYVDDFNGVIDLLNQQRIFMYSLIFSGHN